MTDFVEKDALQVSKHAKLLVHYLMHFTNCKNTIFRVNLGRGNPQLQPGEENTFKVFLELFPYRDVKLIRSGTQNNTIKAYNDVHKLAGILELCPDLWLVDKVVNINDRINYTIQKIDYNLNFIRSDHFKL